MPPSPTLRRSPGLEFRKKSSHRRGHSFESGLPLKAKDDDLVLFNEVQKHETDNFLLHISDDFDDSMSKFRYTSDFELRITIPAQGGSSDLLNTDGDKNDYDWLLTPPDTPLFPSLDDEEPRPCDTSRGQTRSQPISISRPQMESNNPQNIFNERTQRTSRSRASSQRLSLSPQSSYSVVQPAARPSSAPRSSPPSAVRQTTPLRRPSTPTKPSTPTPRSSTPTLRRMSTSPSGQAFSFSRRGTSPVKANRGYSASPKLKGWQSNLPGFPMDAPPNLRISLPNRSTSCVQGLSPASVSSVDSSSKFGRRSMSPSASRSASTSRSYERRQFFSCSKASLASSSDDGVDSVLSIAAGVSDNSTIRKYGVFANNRAMTSYKTTSSLPSASSGPRRSFDSVDHQKARQNMFRPLLSSVSATTFHVGKTDSVHGTMFSGNLSQTTKGNASAKSGLNYASDMGDVDHGQSHLAGEWEKIKDPETQEEALMFNKFDEISEDNGHGTFAGKLQSGTKDFDEGMANEVDVQELESSSGNFGDAVNTATALQSSRIAESSRINCNGIFITCLKCGRHILIMDVDGYKDVCQQCAATDKLLYSREQGANPDKNTDETGKDSLDSPGNNVHLQIGVAEHPEKNSGELMFDQHKNSSRQEIDFCPDNCTSQLVADVGHKHFSEQVTDSLMDIGDPQLSEQLTDNLDDDSAPEATVRFIPQQSNLTADPSLTFDNPQGTGISVLLMQRSSSIKWPVVQGRAFSTICSEPSYSRDKLIGMKRISGRESSSASSSIDLGSSGQTDAGSRKTDICVLHQLRSRKDEVDNMRSNCSTNAESTDSHSEASVIVTEALTHPSSEYEKGFCGIIETGYNEDIEEILVDTAKLVNNCEDANLSVAENISNKKAFIGQDISVCTGTSVASDASCMLLLNPEFCFQLHDTSVQDNLYDENCMLSKKPNEVLFQNDRMGILDIELEVPIPTLESPSIADDHMLNGTGRGDDILDAATNCSCNLILEQQIDKCFQDTQNEHAKSQMPNYMDNSQEGCFLMISDNDMLVSASESNCAKHAPCIEAPRSTQRTFTLEEATDSVLFCSSIVHDLAYKAATIGMEKEMAFSEACLPTVTPFAKSVSNQKDFRKISNQAIQNSRKVKRKRLEIDTKKPPMDLENDVRDPELVSSNAEVSQTVDSMKPPKLESKCNCTVM